MGEAMCSVLKDPDLVSIVLSHADLDPTTFVRVSRVSTTWRNASRDPSGKHLMAAACRQKYLTKTSFAGLFALTSDEANAFPREVVFYPRASSGLMYKYKRDAIDIALPAIGGVTAWEDRLAKRARAKPPPSQRESPCLKVDLYRTEGLDQFCAMIPPGGYCYFTGQCDPYMGGTNEVRIHRLWCGGEA